MSQEELALAAGLTPAYLGRVERGEKCPSVETIYKLSSGLNVPMTEIVDISTELSPAKEQALRRVESILADMPDDAALRLADFIQQLADFRKQ
ncbi:MAG: helix-turn-helix transcriptional regulator [Ruminiclostridium sp.]|nr:helix-turn-helix transcriptional regulator [Ruminiclostridium sp.]